jgi:hypothetical protein
MDDCFPNIAAGPYPLDPWGAVQLPDLGEWTHGIWNVVESGERMAVLERFGYALPYFARKTIRFVDERVLKFSYRVENRGAAPLRYMWSAHPLIAVEGPYELRLPPGELTYCTFPNDGNRHAWPYHDSLDLSREWIAQGQSLKIFISGITEGWCELRLPEHTLRFTFDERVTPVVGVWFNNLGFPSGATAPFRCVAVEPCTSTSDLLDELPAGAYPSIPPGESAEWALRLEINAAHSPRLPEA